MKPPMLHTAYKVATTRNAYGDYTATSSEAIACHFRDIQAISTGSSNETLQCDALAWFGPEADINEQDVIMFGGTHYRVQRITHARRLHETAVQFLKCELDVYGVIS